MKSIILNWKVTDWVAQRTGGVAQPGDVGIGLVEDDRLIAGVSFDRWNGASICMHVAAEPGARWMTRQYLHVCFRYPFEQIKVRKIVGLVGAKNVEARRFDEHLGFVLEATLSDAHPDGSLLVYTMTREQCRWLSLKENPHGKRLAAAPA